MNSMKWFAVLAIVLTSTMVATTVPAQSDDDTRMLRYPDIHDDQVVFSYAGDLWSAPIDGDAPARRLTSHPGLELYPRFSPDGQSIAFTGQYRGDEQVYVIPATGGEPRQLTFYPAPGPLPARWGTDHQVFGWTPDGQAVLFRSGRDEFDDRRLYRVAVDGGLPVALPMPRAGSGDYSPDGRRILYSPLFRDFRTWKRYQGGWAQNLFIYDLQRDEARQVTEHVRTERDPVWLEAGLFYVSDRDGTLELFQYDEDSGEHRQLTDNDTWDIKWASGDGTRRIVYEIAGRLGVYDTATGSARQLRIRVPDDGVRTIARRIEVGDQIEDFDIAPDGKRMLATARGDVFTLPVEHGVTRNLTRRGDAHDREAAWSPDGRHVAFISDRGGEEQLYVVPHDGGEARALTDDLEVRLYDLAWSPDSKRIAMHDHTGRIHVVDLDGGRKVIADSPYEVAADYAWSPDSRWLAWSRRDDNGTPSLFVWSSDDDRVTRLGDGFFAAYSPVFSVDGTHLFFLGDRGFAPQIGSFEWNYVVDRETGIFAYALTSDAPNPFAPRNDETEPKRDEDGDDNEGEDQNDKNDDSRRVAIEFDGLDARAIRVPIESDNILGIEVTKSHLLYATGGAFYYGRQSDAPVTLKSFDLDTRESKTLAENISGLAVSADEKYALIRQNGGFRRIALGGNGDGDRISTANMIVERAPATEWAVAFDEVWRRFRDYFYVPNMHGYDWEVLRARYRPLVEHVSTREDLNYLMGEMIAELNVGHAYVSGGDLQAPDRSSVALLGAHFEADDRNGRYRIAHILPGHNQEPKYRSPLTEVGVDVEPGDYVLAIDGQPLTTAINPYALLTDRGAQPVELLVNDSPDTDGARRVLVEPIDDESALVYLEWVEQNRAHVERRTDGRVGYLHIPDMGANGIYEFIKWYYPQLRKHGLIVDVRGNGGGNVSSMILQRLMKRPLAFGYQAHSQWQDTYPSQAFIGPMVSLISETSASDGDIFPYFFREAGLGPLIGKRTWGGVVGITGRGSLIDGGQVFVPEFGLGQPGEGWIIEGRGVAPDIEVQNDPASEVDAQLERGIAEVIQRIEREAPRFLPKPPSPVKLD
ncbi:MAG: S41 family peptidase [Wenzhouxiangellaceae bacterium]